MGYLMNIGSWQCQCAQLLESVYSSPSSKDANFSASGRARQAIEREREGLVERGLAADDKCIRSLRSVPRSRLGLPRGPARASRRATPPFAQMVNLAAVQESNRAKRPQMRITDETANNRAATGLAVLAAWQIGKEACGIVGQSLSDQRG